MRPNPSFEVCLWKDIYDRQFNELFNKPYALSCTFTPQSFNSSSMTVNTDALCNRWQMATYMYYYSC